MPQELHHLELWFRELVYAIKIGLVIETYKLLTANREDEGELEDEANCLFWLVAMAAFCVSYQKE
jgi:hypothetical protein